MSFITLDFETFYDPKGKYSLKNMSYEEYILDPRFKIHGVAIKIDREPTYYVKDVDVEAHLRDLFYDGNPHHMLCQNTIFDAAILHWHLGLRPSFYYDTMAMGRALRDWESVSLGHMAKRYLDREKGEELVLTEGIRELSDELHDKLGGYAINDVDLTFDLFAELLKFFPQAELYQIHWSTRVFAEPKFVLDTDLTKTTVEKAIKTQAEKIKASGAPATALATGPKFAEYLKEHHDIEVKMVKSPTKVNPDNRKYPLAKDDLQFLKLEANYPELAPLWEGRKAKTSNIEKTRGQRFLGHRQANGNIAVALKYWGAHTGRYSGTNKINMQNLPRTSKLRNCLRAPKGYKVINPDLSNIEGRMSAWFCDHQAKIAGYSTGVDFYNELATNIFGYDVDRKAVDADGKKRFAQEGAIGKTAELGLGYGMGANKFWETCAKGPMGEKPIHLPSGMAQKVVDTWRSMNVPIQQMWKKLDTILEMMADPNIQPFKFGCLEIHYQRIRLPNGMFLNYPRLGYRASIFKNDDGSKKFGYSYWDGKYFKDTWGGTLLENIIQALSRIVMSDSLERMDKWLVEADLGWMVLTVHDENIGIVREGHAERILQTVIEDMRKPPSWALDIPLDAEGGVHDFYVK